MNPNGDRLLKMQAIHRYDLPTIGVHEQSKRMFSEAHILHDPVSSPLRTESSRQSLRQNALGPISCCVDTAIVNALREQEGVEYPVHGEHLACSSCGWWRLDASSWAKTFCRTSPQDRIPWEAGSSLDILVHLLLPPNRPEDMLQYHTVCKFLLHRLTQL